MPDQRYDILIAEDDEQIAYIVQYMLEREGYCVQVAKHGQQAKEIIESGAAPKLALLDIMMPYIDGYQLVKLIRKSPSWREVPIIMLSAKSGEKDIIHALEAGAIDYVVKPFQPGELVARIKMRIKQAA